MSVRATQCERADRQAAVMPPWQRRAWVALGVLSTATGVVGLVVPLLPTTCFLLLGAWCFGKSSPRALALLLRAPVLGALVRARRDGTPIAAPAAAWTLATLWVGIGVSAAIIAHPLVVLALSTLACAVTWHVHTHTVWRARAVVPSLPLPSES
ncbi:MAG: YbaN family protein [Gemmatimonadaceae bacterium]|nr:YbaN family protein [Gemmatimonadaceae bacterium]